MNTPTTTTNGAIHAPHTGPAPSEAHTHTTTTDDDAKRPAAVIDSETLTGACDRLRKLDAKIAAYTVSPSDGDTRASLALVREGIAMAIGALAALPALLVDVSAAVERGKRSRKGEIVAGSVVRIKSQHRAAFAGGGLDADALAAEHTVSSVNEKCVFLKIGDTTLAAGRSQVELSCEPAFETGEIVRIVESKRARVAAQYGIAEGALTDLTVSACNGDKVTLRATVDGGAMALPNVRAAFVERC